MKASPIVPAARPPKPEPPKYYEPKVGIWRSRLTGLCLEVRDIDDEGIHGEVERRRVNKKTGEVKIEKRQVTVRPEVWQFTGRIFEPDESNKG